MADIDLGSHRPPAPQDGRLRAFPWALSVCLALAAATYQLVLASEPVNDHFMNLVWAREILAGHAPVRDFFEAGEPLSEWVSAGAEALFGYRLLAEGMVVAIAIGFSTWVVFWLTYQMTGKTAPAAASSFLVVIAGTRTYSYPKVLIYGVAAALIWRYLQRQTPQRLAALSCWAGLAFLWRHDHGLYTALGVATTVVLAHGLERCSVTRLVLAGCLAALVAAPYLVWVQVYRGIVPYLRDGASVINSEFGDNAPFKLPSWPLWHLDDLVQLDPQIKFAPRAQIQWAPDSTPAQRDAVLKRFGVAGVDPAEPRARSARLMDPRPQNIRGLLNEPIVIDTTGIDRATSSVPDSLWTVTDRMRFRYRLLRTRLFPAFNDAERAGQVDAWLFIGLAVVSIVWSCWPASGDQQSAGIRQRKVIGAIAAMLLFSAPGLLRRPFGIYVPDLVALPAILAGWLGWNSWHATSPRRPMIRVPLRGGIAALWAMLMFAISGVGMLHERVNSLAGQWQSVAQARKTWSDAWARLATTPPVAFWEGKHPPITIELARYVRACTSPDTTLLVVSFAPDLQYYSGRRLASRHLLFGRGRWTDPSDQEASLAKLRGSAAPIVIAEEPFYSGIFSASYPSLARYIATEYTAIGSLSDTNGHVYHVLSRVGLGPSGRVDPQLGWPCLVRGPAARANP